MEGIRKLILATLVMLAATSVVGSAMAAGQPPNPQTQSNPAQSSQAPSGPDITAARQFLESLYANYRVDGEGVPNQTVKEADVYDTSLVVLMHANQQAAGDGEVGYLDGDPLCDCQDFDIRAVKLDFKAVGKNQLVATVMFHNLDRETTLRLALRFTSGGWRVADVISASGSSLRASLQKSTLELKRKSAAH
jgi:hypothetical protein